MSLKRPKAPDAREEALSLDPEAILPLADLPDSFLHGLTQNLGSREVERLLSVSPSVAWALTAASGACAVEILPASLPRTAWAAGLRTNPDSTPSDSKKATEAVSRTPSFALKIGYQFATYTLFGPYSAPTELDLARLLPRMVEAGVLGRLELSALWNQKSDFESNEDSLRALLLRVAPALTLLDLSYLKLGSVSDSLLRFLSDNAASFASLTQLILPLHCLRVCSVEALVSLEALGSGCAVAFDINLHYRGVRDELEGDLRLRSLPETTSTILTLTHVRSSPRVDRDLLMAVRWYLSNIVDWAADLLLISKPILALLFGEETPEPVLIAAATCVGHIAECYGMYNAEETEARAAINRVFDLALGPDHPPGLQDSSALAAGACEASAQILSIWPRDPYVVPGWLTEAQIDGRKRFLEAAGARRDPGRQGRAATVLARAAHVARMAPSSYMSDPSLLEPFFAILDQYAASNPSLYRREVAFSDLPTPVRWALIGIASLCDTVRITFDNETGAYVGSEFDLTVQLPILTCPAARRMILEQYRIANDASTSPLCALISSLADFAASAHDNAMSVVAIHWSARTHQEVSADDGADGSSSEDDNADKEPPVGGLLHKDQAAELELVSALQALAAIVPRFLPTSRDKTNVFDTGLPSELLPKLLRIAFLMIDAAGARPDRRDLIAAAELLIRTFTQKRTRYLHLVDEPALQPCVLLAAAATIGGVHACSSASQRLASWIGQQIASPGPADTSCNTHGMGAAYRYAYGHDGFDLGLWRLFSGLKDKGLAALQHSLCDNLTRALSAPVPDPTIDIEAITVVLMALLALKNANPPPYLLFEVRPVPKVLLPHLFAWMDPGYPNRRYCLLPQTAPAQDGSASSPAWQILGLCALSRMHASNRVLRFLLRHDFQPLERCVSALFQAPAPSSLSLRLAIEATGDIAAELAIRERDGTAPADIRGQLPSALMASFLQALEAVLRSLADTLASGLQSILLNSVCSAASYLTENRHLMSSVRDSLSVLLAHGEDASTMLASPHQSPDPVVRSFIALIPHLAAIVRAAHERTASAEEKERGTKYAESAAKTLRDLLREPSGVPAFFVVGALGEPGSGSDSGPDAEVDGGPGDSSSVLPAGIPESLRQSIRLAAATLRWDGILAGLCDNLR